MGCEVDEQGITTFCPIIGLIVFSYDYFGTTSGKRELGQCFDLPKSLLSYKSQTDVLQSLLTPHSSSASTIL